jgi:hypothetical protein
MGIIKRVGELAERAAVSIRSIFIHPKSVDFVMTTEKGQGLVCELINQHRTVVVCPVYSGLGSSWKTSRYMML